MKKIVLLSVLSLVFSRAARASGCDWSAEGTPYVTRVETVSSEPAPWISRASFQIVCISNRPESDCLPGLQALEPAFNPWLPQNEAWDWGWKSLLIPLADYQLLRDEFMAGRFKTTLTTENVFGSFDDNCGGDYPELKTGRRRYRFEFDHPRLGAREFAFPSAITPRNMIPLY